jgi:hypothetical protein
VVSRNRSAAPRERFELFTATVVERGCEKAAQFFPPGSRERSFLDSLENCPVHYADGDLTILGPEGGIERNLWCFGVDRHHAESIVGFPVGTGFSVEGRTTRSDVLGQFPLDEWMTVEDYADDFLQPGVRRRLQGQVGIAWLPERRFADAYADCFDSEELPDAFVDGDDSKSLQLGDQKLGVDRAGEFDRDDRTRRHDVAYEGTILRVTAETDLTVTGPSYEERTVLLQPGIYVFEPIGVVTVPVEVVRG